MESPCNGHASRSRRSVRGGIAAAIASLSIALVAAACSDGESGEAPPGLSQDAEIVTKSIDVGRYLQKIDAENGWLVDVTLDKTAQPSAEIQIGENDEANVSAEYKRGTLTLTTATGTDLSAPPVAMITTPTLTDATVKSGAEIKATGTLQGTDFEATLTRGSKIDAQDANLQTASFEGDDQASVTFTGGSMNTLTLNGKANSTFDLGGVTSNSVAVTLTGSSTAQIGDSNMLTVDASDDSKLTYGGEPQLAQTVTGNATVEKASGSS